MSINPFDTIKANIVFLFTVAILLANMAGGSEAAPPPSHIRPAIMISPVFSEKGAKCELLLKSKLPLHQYSSFFLSDPSRLVIDIHQADFQEKYHSKTGSCGDIVKVRIASHKDKIRVVFDLVEKHEIKHSIAQVEDGLKISIEKEMMPVEDMPGISVPSESKMIVSSGNDFLKVTFTTEDYAPIYLPIAGGYRVLWQLTGTYWVKGYVDGRKVRFRTTGSTEYLGTPLILD